VPFGALGDPFFRFISRSRTSFFRVAKEKSSVNNVDDSKFAVFGKPLEEVPFDGVSGGITWRARMHNPHFPISII